MHNQRLNLYYCFLDAGNYDSKAFQKQFHLKNILILHVKLRLLGQREDVAIITRRVRPDSELNIQIFVRKVMTSRYFNNNNNFALKIKYSFK